MKELNKSFDHDMKQFNNETVPATITKPKKTKRNVIIAIGMLMVVVIAVGLYFFVFKKQASAPTDSEATTNQPEETTKDRLRLIVTGDTIAHDSVNQEAQQGDGYEYSDMFGALPAIFANADLRFCNQATLAGGTEFGVSGYPTFNAPTELTRDMQELGCNIINTGSNHTNDYGQDVISSAVQAWEGQPDVFAVAGANANESQKQEVRYFEKKGVKFAFVSYTTYSNETAPSSYSVTMYSDKLAKKQLAEARSKADVVIASMRWGTEYSPEINTKQKTIAKDVVNYGADIILGHGPHVLQSVEKLTLDDNREAYVWYSLGNFLNTQLQPEALFNVIGVMDFDTKTKKLTDISYLPIYMHYEWTAEEKANGDLFKRKNLKLYTFDQAKEYINKSQLDTSLEAQDERIKSTLQKLIDVDTLKVEDYLQS